MEFVMDVEKIVLVPSETDNVLKDEQTEKCTLTLSQGMPKYEIKEGYPDNLIKGNDPWIKITFGTWKQGNLRGLGTDIKPRKVKIIIEE